MLRLYGVCTIHVLLWLHCFSVQPAASEQVTGTLILNNQALYTTRPSVEMILIATGGSGVITQVRIQNDNGIWGDWQPYTPFLAFPVSNQTPGTKQFCAIFRDSEQTESTPACASIEYRIPAISSLGRLKVAEPGEAFSIRGCTVVSAIQQTATVYLSDDSGLPGMKCLWNGETPVQGQVVDVEGVVYTPDTVPEFYLTAVSPTGVNHSVRPVTMRCRSVGGNHPALAQVGYKGADNTFSYVRTTGRVISIEPDGFRVNDGSLPALSPGLKVRTGEGWPSPETGDYVTTSGIVFRASTAPFEAFLQPFETSQIQYLYGK